MLWFDSCYSFLFLKFGGCCHFQVEMATDTRKEKEVSEIPLQGEWKEEDLFCSPVID